MQIKSNQIKSMNQSIEIIYCRGEGNAGMSKAMKNILTNSHAKHMQQI